MQQDKFNIMWFQKFEITLTLMILDKLPNNAEIIIAKKLEIPCYKWQKSIQAIRGEYRIIVLWWKKLCVRFGIIRFSFQLKI